MCVCSSREDDGILDNILCVSAVPEKMMDGIPEKFMLKNDLAAELEDGCRNRKEIMVSSARPCHLRSM